MDAIQLMVSEYVRNNGNANLDQCVGKGELTDYLIIHKVPENIIKKVLIEDVKFIGYELNRIGNLLYDENIKIFEKVREVKMEDLKGSIFGAKRIPKVTEKTYRYVYCKTFIDFVKFLNMCGKVAMEDKNYLDNLTEWE